MQKHTLVIPPEVTDNVLVFYGQTSEKIFESNDEKSRFRKYSIIYYLNDSKYQIIEKKEENSGILQGK